MEHETSASDVEIVAETIEKNLPQVPATEQTNRLAENDYGLVKKFKELNKSETAVAVPSPSPSEIQDLSSRALPYSTISTDSKSKLQKTFGLKNTLMSKSASLRDASKNYLASGSHSAASLAAKTMKSASFSLKQKFLGSAVSPSSSSSDLLAKSLTNTVPIMATVPGVFQPVSTESLHVDTPKLIIIEPPEPPIPSFLTMLPSQVVLSILARLPTGALVTCSEVSLSWYGVVNRNQNLWFLLCVNKGWNRPLPPRMTIIDWKQVFIRRFQAEKRWLTGAGIKTTTMQCHEGPIYCIKADDEIVTAGSDGALKLWFRPEPLKANEPSPSKLYHGRHHRRKSTNASGKSKISSDSSQSEDVSTADSDETEKMLQERLCVFAPKHAVFKATDTVYQPSPITCMLSQVSSHSRIIGGLYDGSLVVWNAHNLDIVCHLLREHKDSISSLKSITADEIVANSSLNHDFIFISGSYDGQARIYRIIDYWKSGITSARVSSDEYYTHAGRFSIKLMGVKNFAGRQIFCQHVLRKPSNHRVSLIASGLDNGSVQLWNWKILTAEYSIDDLCKDENANEQQVVDENIATLEGHYDVVTCLEQLTSRDDCYILASASSDKTVRIWKINDNMSAECLQEIKFKSLVRSIQLRNACDNLVIVSLDPQTLEIWKPAKSDSVIEKLYSLDSVSSIVEQLSANKGSKQRQRIVSIDSTPFELLLTCSNGSLVRIEF